ncbi:MAG: PilZ domain-containing protein [Minicystis sp.]
MSSDRRSVRRSVFVDCQVVRERGFDLIGERAVDLSQDGMLLLTERAVRLGEELIVTFRIPGTRRWIDTMATVVRTVAGRRRGDRGPAVGLAFEPLSPEDNLLVRGMLDRFPPTYPARAPRVDYAATAALIALS